MPPAALAGVAPYVAAASRRRDVNARGERARRGAGVRFAGGGVRRERALGYLWVFWSLGLSCVIHASQFSISRRRSRLLLVRDVAFLAPASALASPVAYVTFALINEKVGISGSEPWPLGLVVGDLTMGVAAGACVALAGFGAFPLARCDRKQIRRGWRAVSAAWLVFAAVARSARRTPSRRRNDSVCCTSTSRWTHFETFPRNARARRRDARGRVRRRSAANALAPLTRAAILRPTKREDFASMHPVTQLLGEGVALPARAAAAPPWGDRPPALEVRLMRHVAADLEKKMPGSLGEARRRRASRPGVAGEGAANRAPAARRKTRRFRSSAAAGREIRRCEIHLQRDARERGFRTRAPAWSCVRVRGDVTAWSLSPTLPGTPPGAAEGTKRKSDPLWARHAETAPRRACGGSGWTSRTSARRPSWRCRRESVPGGGQRGDPGRHRRTRSGNLSHRGDDVPQRADATERRGTRRRVRCFFFFREKF